MADDLLKAASAARATAYAPYSNFAVGAALRGRSGHIFAGANVENAAYPEGCCAETSAISRMVCEGEREIVEVLVIADTDRPITPCGGCRQRLAEFAGPDTPVHAADPSGIRKTFRLGELLPAAFDFSREGE